MRLVVAAGLLLAATVSAQERTLPVPPNVFVDGVPPIPAAISEGIAPYTQFRRARVLAWHPIERRLIISTRFGDVPQLHDVRVPGGARRQLTFFRDGVTDRPAVVFDPGGRSFTFVKDVASGGEANQLFRYDLATNAITRLTEGRSKNEGPVVSRRGLVAYATTRRNSKDYDIHVINPADPGTDRQVLQGTGIWFPIAWSADESRIAAVEIDLERANVSLAGRRRLGTADGAQRSHRRAGAVGRRGFYARRQGTLRAVESPGRRHARHPARHRRQASGRW